MRTTIARLAPRERSATAFCIFNAVYGVAWFAGSVLLGILYDPSIAGVVIASDGAAGGDVAAPALVGLPTRRVIGIAPTPAIP